MVSGKSEWDLLHLRVEGFDALPDASSGAVAVLAAGGRGRSSTSSIRAVLMWAVPAEVVPVAAPSLSISSMAAESSAIRALNALNRFVPDPDPDADEFPCGLELPPLLDPDAAGVLLSGRLDAFSGLDQQSLVS